MNIKNIPTPPPPTPVLFYQLCWFAAEEPFLFCRCIIHSYPFCISILSESTAMRQFYCLVAAVRRWLSTCLWWQEWQRQWLLWLRHWQRWQGHWQTPSSHRTGGKEWWPSSSGLPEFDNGSGGDGCRDRGRTSIPLPKLDASSNLMFSMLYKFGLRTNILLVNHAWSMGYNRVTNWQYYTMNVNKDHATEKRRMPVSPRPMDPGQPSRMMERVGSITRLFWGRNGQGLFGEQVEIKWGGCQGVNQGERNSLSVCVERGVWLVAGGGGGPRPWKA